MNGIFYFWGFLIVTFHFAFFVGSAWRPWRLGGEKIFLLAAIGVCMPLGAFAVESSEL
jgi:hypothetical protein